MANVSVKLYCWTLKFHKVV